MEQHSKDKIYQIDNVPVFYTKNALVRVIRTISGDFKIAIPKGLHSIEHKPTNYESPEDAKFDKNGFEGYAPSQLSDDDLFYLLIHEGYVSYENESALMQLFGCEGPAYHKISEHVLKTN